MLTTEEKEKLLKKLNSAVGTYSECKASKAEEEPQEEEESLDEEPEEESEGPVDPKKNMAIIIALKKKMGKK
jgi:hypothetical protein